MSFICEIRRRPKSAAVQPQQRPAILSTAKTSRPTLHLKPAS